MPGGILAYLIAGIALVAALVGGYVKIHHDGYVEGKQEVQVLWDEANRKAADQEAARQAAAKLVADISRAELAAAQQRATTADAKWRSERAKHPDSTLAGCKSSPGSPVANATAKPDGLTLKFSAAFLRLYDRVWTGQTGEPVFPDRPPGAGQPADSPDALTEIGPGEVLDNHQLNAEACSRDRRKLNSLIDQIEKLRAGWR